MSLSASLSNETNAEIPVAVQDVVDGVGDFIEYWGFKKIHGKIWALIFLSETPVDAGYLIEKLGVSKALVSMSLKDLLAYNVIIEQKQGRSTMHYVANEDIYSVIIDVIIKREAQMIAKIRGMVEIMDIMPEKKLAPFASKRRIKDLLVMSKMADGVLKSLITLKTLDLSRFKKALQLGRR